MIISNISHFLKKTLRRCIRVPDRFLWWLNLRYKLKKYVVSKKYENQIWENDYVKSFLHHSHQNKLITLSFLRAIKKRNIFLDKLIKSNRVIELGCGTGEFSHFINKKFKNKKILGVEISKNAVNLANYLYSNENVRFALISQNENLQKFEEFDIAICSQVLEHFSKPNVIIDKMLEISPIVIALVPYKQLIMDPYKEEGGGGHVFRFSEESFSPYNVLDSFIFRTLGWDYSSSGETPRQLAVILTKTV